MKHELKYCPRCGSEFECKINNVLKCNCSLIEISTKVASQIARTYGDCLCNKCLQTLVNSQPIKTPRA